MPSNGRGNLFLRRRRGILCDRARWIYKMASTGRDFPGKVCPMAFSKCRRPRKDSNIAPGGQGFCIPSGAATYHRARFILMAPSQWNWKCTASEECEMTLSGKYKCTSAEKRIPLPPPKRTGCPDPRRKECHYLLRPRNARVPGTTSVISGTPGHYWLNKSGSDLLSHLVGQYHRRARA